MISVRNILIALVGLAYIAISYIATTVPHPPMVTVLVGFVPIGIAALVGAWKSPARAYLLPLFMICVLLIGFYIEKLRDHAAWLYFVQHVGAMTLLGLVFGSTLASTHAEALCSRMASLMIPEPLGADYFRYTWNVTLAWTIYFAVSAALSILLFFYAPIQAWSIFADVLTPVTLGLMFAVEYLVRRRVLPNGPSPSIAATIKAYRLFNQRQS